MLKKLLERAKKVKVKEMPGAAIEAYRGYVDLADSGIDAGIGLF